MGKECKDCNSEYSVKGTSTTVIVQGSPGPPGPPGKREYYYSEAYAFNDSNIPASTGSSWENLSCFTFVANYINTNLESLLISFDLIIDDEDAPKEIEYRLNGVKLGDSLPLQNLATTNLNNGGSGAINFTIKITRLSSSTAQVNFYFFGTLVSSYAESIDWTNNNTFCVSADAGADEIKLLNHFAEIIEYN